MAEASGHGPLTRSSRKLWELVSSGAEPPPPALSGPDVTVSRHPAATERPLVRANRCQ